MQAAITAGYLSSVGLPPLPPSFVHTLVISSSSFPSFSFSLPSSFLSYVYVALTRTMLLALFMSRRVRGLGFVQMTLSNCAIISLPLFYAITTPFPVILKSRVFYSLYCSFPLSLFFSASSECNLIIVANIRISIKELYAQKFFKIPRVFPHSSVFPIQH